MRGSTAPRIVRKCCAIRRDARFVRRSAVKSRCHMLRAIFRRLVQCAEGEAVDAVDHHLVERPVQLELRRAGQRLRESCPAGRRAGAENTSRPRNE